MASQHIPNPLAELLAEEAMVAGSPVFGRRSLARAFAGFAAAAASLGLPASVLPPRDSLTSGEAVGYSWV